MFFLVFFRNWSILLKMKNHFVILSFLLILIICSACSSDPINSESASSNLYSSTTDKEFEKIENGDTNRAPNYRQKINTPKTKPNTVLTIDNKLNTKAQDRLLEINQNLAFYCMKHRKDSAFANEEKCLEFTGKVLNSCKQNNGSTINTAMLNCIKERLKKKS
jgi:hypothetical protein